MTDEERAFHEAAMPIGFHLMTRTAGFVTARGGAGVGEPTLNSGTFVRIGDRFLIATAAHCIDGYSLDEIFVMPRWRRKTDPYPPLLGKGLRDDGEIDVAWIEMDSSVFDEMTAFEFIGIDRIDLNPGSIELGAITFGYPARFIDQDLLKNRNAVRATPTGYFSAPLPSERWPDGRSRDRNLYVDFPKFGAWSTSPRDAIELESPHGISGGGMWATHFSDTNVWSPDAMKLVAIEYAWHPTQRWLRGSPMRHWLQMVAEDIPDLRPILAPVLAPPP